MDTWIEICSGLFIWLKKMVLRVFLVDCFWCDSLCSRFPFNRPSPMFAYHIISYLNHIISKSYLNHSTLYHIRSYHIISYHIWIISHYIISYHILSCWHCIGISPRTQRVSTCFHPGDLATGPHQSPAQSHRNSSENFSQLGMVTCINRCV